MTKAATKKKVITAKAKKIFCSVCPKWEIKRPERCSNTKTVKGILHYFCTAKCKERFEKSPEKFL
jgi:YHS domain-containing protein